MEHYILNGMECKECTKCHKILPLANYRRDKYKSDGLSSSCRKCCSEKDKQIYNKNPSKKIAQVAAYMKRTGLYNAYHPYNAKYYSSPESKTKKKIRDRKRRELEKQAQAEHPINKDVIAKLINENDGKCEYCGKYCADNYHIDHRTPLFRGGTNKAENLSLCCPSCNWSKGKKTAEEYMNSIVQAE